MTNERTTARPTYRGHGISHTPLSDGRVMLYFSDHGTASAPDNAVDRRDPFPRPRHPEMRYDSLTGEWISVAADRNQRAHLPSTDQCPLCPQTEANLSEIPHPFDVAVFENRNPSFSPGSAVSPDNPNREAPFGLVNPAVGRCEVVVFSPEHRGSFHNQPTTRLHTIYTAWQHRTEDLMGMPGVTTVFPFENRGEEIGVTLHHPHGQIYGYPYVPPTVEKVLHSSRTFGPGFFAQFLNYERRSPRVIYQGESFTAFVPFAARWPLEVMVLPHRDIGLLTELTDDEVEEALNIHQRILRSFDALYDSETPYISGWYQAPRGVSGAVMRLHLKMFSPRRAANKLKFLAGSESAMGAFVSDVTPETQADNIRSVLS